MQVTKTFLINHPSWWWTGDDKTSQDSDDKADSGEKTEDTEEGDEEEEEDGEEEEEEGEGQEDEEAKDEVFLHFWCRVAKIVVESRACKASCLTRELNTVKFLSVGVSIDRC